MTVTSSIQDSSHATDGSTTSFPTGFYFLNEKEVFVDRIDSNGAVTSLVLGTDYSVSGAGVEAGGTVTTTVAYPAGSILHLYRLVPVTQETQYQQNDPFPAKTTEKALDKLTMIAQQTHAATLNSIRYPLSEYGTDGTLPLKYARGSTVLGFDASGAQTLLPLPSALGAGDLRFDTFAAGTDFEPGVTQQLILSRAPISAANCWVYWDGVEQLDFNLVGNVLTFPTPIYDGVNVVKVRIGTTLSGNIPAQSSVTDDTIAWTNLLARVVTHVDALKALSTTRYSHASTKGYYAQGDGGADEFYALPPHSSLITPAVLGDVPANDGGVWRRVFKGRVNSKQLGLLGDGNQNGTAGTDQAELFQSILDNLPPYTTLEFLPGYYNVSSIDFNANVTNCTFIFNDAWISGVSTSAKDAIIRMNGCNNNKFYNLQIVSDGAATTVLHQQNYGCALQFKGDASLVPPINTCFNYFYGGSIRYIKAGVCYGSLLGQPATPSSQMSENWFFGFQFRGVLQPVYGNAINSYSTWIGCNFLAQRMESNTSWWNDSAGFCVRNDYNDTGNHMVMIGCEFQRAIMTGTSVFGANMTIRDAVWEVGCPAVLTGDNLISGDADGFFGPSGIAPFSIAAGSTGTLTLEDFRLSRASGVAATDRAKFVDATGSISYRVVMRKCHIQEFYFEGFQGGATFVHGCQAKFEDVTIDNATTTSWYLDDGRTNCINNVDRSGTSLPTSGTTSSFGGWVVTANASAGAYRQLAGDGPFGLAQCIQVVTAADGLNLATDTTNRFKVEGNRDYHFSMPMKFMTTTSTAYIRPVVDWYDYGGNLVSSQNLGQLDQSFAAATGFNSWQMYRAPAKAPVNAFTAVVRFIFGAGSTIGFALPSLN
ncbi:TPA: hypothetical protein QDB46_003218 [Burkholderia multivorans]|nr:hypothetical protein [Burkholderia multivorans]HDR9291908.1 hypothetical protein [Burkholderia multivorans]HDR9297802.1 hypothetical protein [Burkholderia multivorans]HDR9303274.1 hypothetical protein [Burkholderia multivorans]HDR9309390.1 hypothetical protein [Burkholderia multivorans]